MGILTKVSFHQVNGESIQPIKKIMPLLNFFIMIYLRYSRNAATKNLSFQEKKTLKYFTDDFFQVIESAVEINGSEQRLECLG